MPANALNGFEPRQTPIQTRAAVTVGAISEATIQILLKQGVNRLTTTRVAERAGVSVGTLYQYSPNKQSLLFAVLADHLDKVAAAFEAACEQARQPLSDMVRAVVEAFVDAKMERIDVSLALYQFAADVGGPALAKRVGQRSRKALEAMLQTSAIAHVRNRRHPEAARARTRPAGRSVEDALPCRLCDWCSPSPAAPGRRSHEVRSPSPRFSRCPPNSYRMADNTRS
jgi:AcrR family transcriptional regulator